MKCPACGNAIADDARRCPHCGKYLFGNAPESDAGEAAAEFAVSGGSGVSRERLCPCCQALLKTGAAFCGNCGLPADGQGGNPYAGSVKRGGSAGSDSAMALSLMKEMNTMKAWIISGAVFMALTALACALPWSITFEKLVYSNGYHVFLLFLVSGSLIAYGGILFRTPFLVQRCGELCGDDRDLAKRISRVRQHVKNRWILLTLNLVFLLTFSFLAVLVAALSFLGLINGLIYAFTGTRQLPVTWDGVMLLVCADGIFGALFLVSIIADLVVQAFMLIDFVKIKKAIGRMTVRGH